MTGWGRGVLACLPLLALAGSPSPGLGQGLPGVVERCGMGSEVVLSLCQDAVLGVQSAQGSLALAGTGGSDLPGSASTLGWRLEDAPRFSVSAQGLVIRSSLPELGSASRFGQERSPVLFSGRFSGTLGLFDGFSPVPTMGGVFALDLATSAHLISAPEKDGFQGGLLGWGIGARLGVVRESFSLPGISVSIFHRWLGETGLGRVEDGAPVEARFDVRVLAVRGVVGKDFWGVGVLAGGGWDRSGGDATVLVPDPGGELPAGVPSSVTSFEQESSRRVVFLGASRTFLTLQLSGEIGWAEGFEADGFQSPGSGGFDPKASSYFGSLSLRLTI